MQAVEDLALVCRESDQHLGSLAPHAHEADRGFGVAVGDCLKNYIDGVGLGIESCGLVVPVATAFAVVNDDHYRFQDHLDGGANSRLSNEDGVRRDLKDQVVATDRFETVGKLVKKCCGECVGGW